MDVLIWVAAGVVLAVAEVLTVTLVLAMFSVGAFAAAIAAGLGAPLWAQITLCALVSVLCLVAVRPVLRRHRRRAVPHRAAAIGMESLLGSLATVLTPVDDGAGQVKFDGEVWSARAAVDGQRFEPGTRVRVVGVDGATVQVGATSEAGEGER
ncbi:membrane protein [Pilimelia terevasa]|uniref:Membrane protein n=1 Tax=Pilimelia terevasa TaxID=53372 RepID=A0A8J3FJM0_9ACTN|nr:NfeD family protein [Pilimelia terevasa]GGK24316.1 membrane protein [Pilimelia terevasa]